MQYTLGRSTGPGEPGVPRAFSGKDKEAVAMGLRVRAMTWNIRASQGGDDAPVDHDPVAHLQCIADVIRESGADIVGLQEVDRFWSRSGGVDQPERLAEVLGMESVYMANFHPDGEEGTEYGIALMSRWPILTVHRISHGNPDGWEPRGGIVAILKLPNDGTVEVATTHLQVDPPGEPGKARGQRAGGLDLMLDTVGVPGIIMGDFNALPGSPEMARIEREWTDTWRATRPADAGHTYPATRDSEPVQRIDYVFTGAGISVIDAERLIDERTRLASDHFPVTADVEVDHLQD